MIPYEYADRRGDRILTDWRLQDDQRRRINSLLWALEDADRELAVSSIIFKKNSPGIYYAKINGRVALRPRLCIGPAGDNEVTFLERVTKKDNRENPPIGESRAPHRLTQLKRGSARRSQVTIHKPGT